MKIENIQVTGFEAAFRGMRNPLNSWAKSTPEADLELAHKLAKAGPVHGKFRRMIIVTMDIVAPLYWWKEFDTYKVGTVANSCSTMHTLMNRPFDESDFEMDDNYETWSHTCDILNERRNDYFEARQQGRNEDTVYIWRTIIAMLPSGYLQRRTVLLNYEVLSHMFKDRQGHKLKEWKILLDAITTLPHANELILADAFESKESTVTTNKAPEELNDNIKNVKPVVFDANMFTPAEKFNSKYTCENRVNGLQAALNHIDEVAENFNNFARDISNSKRLDSLYTGEELKKKTFNEIRAGYGLPPIKDDIQKEFISNDPINPSHYKDHCSIECIEAMEIAFGGGETGYFCLGNAFKYLWRHKYKNGQEDLEKAIWYLDKAEELGADPEKINDIRDIVEKYMKEE